MRTAASEHLNNEQMMSRLSATFSALIREEIDIVRRFLDSDSPNLEGHEMGPLVELSVRLVERSAEWLDVGTVASLARELRESLLQIGNLRPAQRQEFLNHCRVALDTQEKLADQLRTDGFAALLAHAASVGDAVDQLRARLGRAKSEALNASRGVIDDVTPDMAPRENLLALTFEIKSSLVHQNDRIGTISDGLGISLRTMQMALTEWDGLMKAIDPSRGGTAPAEAPAAGSRRRANPGPTVAARAVQIHQKLEEVAAGMRTLVHDLHQLLGIQYSLERRARDLDEHLLWEFLDPLDRFVDDFYAAASRRDTETRRSVLTVQTGGVGFEPEIGAILLPLLFRLLETASSPEGHETRDLRLSAAREGLEARIAIEGCVAFEPDALQQLESGLEELGGFVTLQGGPNGGSSLLHLQFPMARSLRGFLIVESAGHRVALPWSAIERICSSAEELSWSDAGEQPEIVPLASLFTPLDAADPVVPRRSSETARPSNGPLAILRCGGGTGAISFDRIVWRENARLTPLPPRLYPVEEVFGGIIGSDGQVTLVLHPAAVMRRLRGAAFGGSGAPAAHEEETA